MKITNKQSNPKSVNLISENWIKTARATVDKRFYLVAIVIFAVLVGWVTYNQVSPKNSSKPSSTTVKLPEVTPFGPEIVRSSDIRKAASTVGHALYWAGEKANQQLEMTIIRNGSVYIRYLPLGAKAGTKKQSFTVVTFSDVNGYSHVQSSARQAGAISAADSGGAVVVESSKKSLNAYFAYKNYPIQIEVFTPTPGKAWDLIQTGQIQLVN
jgi:hypothetical protein